MAKTATDREQNEIEQLVNFSFFTVPPPSADTSFFRSDVECLRIQKRIIRTSRLEKREVFETF